MALDERPRPKDGKWSETYMAPFWRENQWVRTPKKKSQKGELMIEEPRCKLRSNSRIQFASNESKLVPMNLDP
jgi:hypothetical protein